MNIEQIHNLINNGSLPGSSLNPSLKETHISWIILADEFAYKIKRPVKYSFLDFSSLEKRKYYCHEELRLNKQLAPEMYLKVVPVKAGMLGNSSAVNNDETIDFAVKMKRMDNRLEMDRLLKEDKVKSEQIVILAEKLANFHKSTDIINEYFDIENLQKMYGDIQSLVPFLKEKASGAWNRKIANCVDMSERFLKNNREFINERVGKGFRRDCHGDLNSSNIFLYENNPVIFDCIEFNEEFRQIDILNEIAFLCIDIEFFGKKKISERLWKEYKGYYGLQDTPQSRKLFMYYKSYRANVRAKVTLISAKKMKTGNGSEKIKDALRYLSLMEGYAGYVSRQAK
jgi:uncharacterized protein